MVRRSGRGDATTTVAELFSGVEFLPKGKRRDTLHSGLLLLIDTLFKDRILSFGFSEAIEFSRLYAATRGAGISLSFSDAQIAATAIVHAFSVATRDVDPFRAAGAKVINPWE